MGIDYKEHKGTFPGNEGTLQSDTFYFFLKYIWDFFRCGRVKDTGKTTFAKGISLLTVPKRRGHTLEVSGLVRRQKELWESMA